MSLVSIRKKGYLNKLPVSSSLKRWSRKWFVLHATNIDGVVRLVYFDGEDCEVTETGKRSVPLRGVKDCREMIRGIKGHPYVFEFTSQLGHHVFSADSKADMNEWIQCIREAIDEDKLKSRRGVKSMYSKGSQSSAGSVEEGSAGDGSNQRDPTHAITSGTYRVTLEPNDMARKLNLEGQYNLEVTPDALTLTSATSAAQIAMWDYKHIKSYGRTKKKINIDIGRSGETGAGTFIFETSCAKELFGLINRNICNIRKQMEMQMTKQSLREAVGTTTKRVVTRRTSAGKYEIGASRSRPRPKSQSQQAEPSQVSGTYRKSLTIEDQEAMRQLEEQYNDFEFLPSTGGPTVPRKRTSFPTALASVGEEGISTGGGSVSGPGYTSSMSDPFQEFGDPFSSPVAGGTSDMAGGPNPFGEDLGKPFFEGPTGPTPGPTHGHRPKPSGVKNPLRALDGSFLQAHESDSKILQSLGDLELDEDLPDVGEVVRKTTAHGHAQDRGHAHGRSRPRPQSKSAPSVPPPYTAPGRPPGPPPSSSSSSSSGKKKPLVKRMSQQELEDMFDNIVADLGELTD